MQLSLPIETKAELLAGFNPWFYHDWVRKPSFLLYYSTEFDKFRFLRPSL